MAQVNRLSPREREVISLLMQGKSNKQIALTLGISIRTVEFHLTNIYAKLQVSSRIELILKLGSSAGRTKTEMLGFSVVDTRGKDADNRDIRISKIIWAAFPKYAISIFGKETEMKKRWVFYFLAGLVFGAGYWHYLSLTANFFSSISIYFSSSVEGLLLVPALLAYFGVWLIPAILPAVYDFYRSRSLHSSVMAVVVVWLSAVLGYYVNYVIMLAIFGLPHMEYLVILGHRTSNLWQDWRELFPRLILIKFLKWAVVGAIASAIAGYITGSLLKTAYLKRSYKTSPVQS
ncbi:MAG TPA: helix-turn-helix transcriptional regulator [Anaerolineales bacterium]|nr:helix-turn-helix transcriptional regulator [Anaerolineales bacterium]